MSAGEINPIAHLKQATDEAFVDLDLASKNIANLSTPNYKALRRGSFSDEFNATQRLMHPAKLAVSDNPHDVAIDGQGFFAVVDEDKKILLTRRLNISQNNEGFLISEGKIICPPLRLPHTFARFKVKADGSLIGISQADGQSLKVGQLLVINYPGADRLDFDGEYYHPNQEAGQPLRVNLGVTNQSRLRQGMIEVANVNLGVEIARFKSNTERINILRQMIQSFAQARGGRVNELGQLLN